MHKKLLQTTICLFLSALFALPLHAQEGPTDPQRVAQNSFSQKDWKFYGTHAGTALALGVGRQALYNLCEKSVTNPQISSAIECAIDLSVIYVLYKTPQWTDTYVLKNNIQRTTEQNIGRFVANPLFPFGPALADYYMDLKTKEPSATIEEEKPETH
jgi:hypothetical protein